MQLESLPVTLIPPLLYINQNWTRGITTTAGQKVACCMYPQVSFRTPPPLISKINLQKKWERSLFNQFSTLIMTSQILTIEEIKQFQSLAKDVLGLDLSLDEAEDQGIRLTILFEGLVNNEKQKHILDNQILEVNND
jgi:hypothetical protein